MVQTRKEGTDKGFIFESTNSNKSKSKLDKTRRRVDLRMTLYGHKFRLQAYEDTQTGKLLLWLKSLPLRERDEKIMEALQAFYYPDALMKARENSEEFKDITDEKIKQAGWLSLNQMITQMESIEFLLIHDLNNLDPQQKLKDWETARALVKGRIGENLYNYLTLNGAPNDSAVN